MRRLFAARIDAIEHTNRAVCFRGVVIKTLTIVCEAQAPAQLRLRLEQLTLIAVFEGFYAQPTAEGVSRATTRTVVNSALAVLALDYLLTAFMF